MKVEWRRLALTSSQSARHRLHGGGESLPSVGGGLSSTERKCGEKTNYGKIGEYRMIQIADSFHGRGSRRIGLDVGEDKENHARTMPCVGRNGIEIT